MFGSSCTTGCIQIPTPVYYWGPYAFPTTFGKKSFHIADIIQASQDYYKTSSGVGLALGTSRRPDPAHAASNKPTIRAYNPNTNNSDDTNNRSQRPSHILSLGYNSQMTENGSESNEAINYSTKVVDKHIKCSVPSALEPLQALCSSELRGYDGFGVNNSKKRSTSVGEQSKVLKFGMSRILSDDFGKDDSKINDKENTKTFDALRPCECTYDGCHGYPSFRFPSHALSAVHALQPPKYPHGSGTDTLPGPYSVLNTEVNIGSQSKRKRSWSRAVFSNLQRKGLEKRFEVQKYVTKPDRRQLAAMLGLTDAQVKVWFQNRRMKWRHAQQCSQTEPTDLDRADQVNHDDAGNDVMQGPEVDRCEYPANQIDPSGIQTDDDSDSLDDIEEDMNIIVVNENEDSCANVTSDISNYSS